MPKELVDAAMQENARLFALPLEEKMKLKINKDFRVSLPYDDHFTHEVRGYTVESN